MLKKAPGLDVVDDPANKVYPMPLFTAEKYNCEVGRLRVDCALDNGLCFWVVGDQLLKGAAEGTLDVPGYRNLAHAGIRAGEEMLAADKAKLAQWDANKAIPMWHASPVQGIDRFSLSKAGTGQGAAVYGHGLYQAESPLVSGPGGQYDVEMTQKNLRARKVPLHSTWDDWSNYSTQNSLVWKMVTAQTSKARSFCSPYS